MPKGRPGFSGVLRAGIEAAVREVRPQATAAGVGERPMETIRVRARSRDTWLIIGAHEEEMREMLSQTREFDLRGPLRCCLGRVRRRQRRAGRPAGGLGRAPLRRNGTRGRPEPVP